MYARSGMLLVAVGLTCVGVTVGCNREKRATEYLLTEAVNAHAHLQPKLEELKAALGGLQKDVEDLAAAVPGGDELRAKYFGADEVVGEAVVTEAAAPAVTEIDAEKA